MSNDSGRFRTFGQLSIAGGKLHDMRWTLPGGEIYLPLYEAKMVHHYDHRWATYEENGKDLRDCTDDEKSDPDYRAMPRYWVPESEVNERLIKRDKDGNVVWRWGYQWLLGWRDICRSTDERTVIGGVVPKLGAGNNVPLIFVDDNLSPNTISGLIGNLASMMFDFAARHKVGGTHLNFFIIKQLPVLPPEVYGLGDLHFIAPRILELTYTNEDLRPFSEDLGYFGDPFRWNPVRRRILRAELYGYYAHLYDLTRDELRYILDPADVYGKDYPSETFQVLKNKDIKESGDYRTLEMVLHYHDRIQTFKDAGKPYEPDYDPPPVDLPIPGDGVSQQKSLN